MEKGYYDFLLPQYIILTKLFQYTVDPGYNDNVLSDNSSITSHILWYQLCHCNNNIILLDAQFLYPVIYVLH
jgi:hypothetical protein